MHQRAGGLACGPETVGACSRRIRARRRPRGPCSIGRGARMSAGAIRVRRAVERMRPYNPPLEGRTDKLRLDFNENPIGCSPAVRRALAKLSAASISAYPEQASVRRKLAKFFGVSPAELLLTNGTDEALSLIVNTFVEPNDEVLFVEPTYAMYRFYSELAGARVVVPRYTVGMEFPWAEA